MQLILTFLTSLHLLAAPPDTLRHDGYYLHISEQATTWHLLYFRADGTFMDSSSSGTPPVFDIQALRHTHGSYRISRKRKEDVITFTATTLAKDIGAPGARSFTYGFFRDNLVFGSWLDAGEKWRKIKDHYFFIPF